MLSIAQYQFNYNLISDLQYDNNTKYIYLTASWPMGIPTEVCLIDTELPQQLSTR